MIGEKLGKYTILENLGTGSMGSVYKAEDPTAGRLVALKLVKAHTLYSPEKRERFLQGLLAASEARHPGICPILEIGDDNDDFFVVMPFLEGQTLDQYMSGRALPWKEAFDIAIRAGEALAAGHAAGAVHRGLKPANFWILKDGQVVVTDFGMARFTELEKGGRMTLPSKRKLEFADAIIPMAALAYMSPEQVRGSPVDYRSDIFSFGVMLYEMLTGSHPFESRNSLSRMHAILEADPALVASRGVPLPPELNLVLQRALAKAPEGRHPNMHALLVELRQVRDRGQAPEAAGLVRDASKPERSPGRFRYSIVALAAVLLVLLALYFLWKKSG